MRLPITIRWRRSRSIAVCLGGLHASALAVLAVAELPPSLAVGGGVLLIASAVWSARTWWRSQGFLNLQADGGCVYRAQLDAEACLTAVLWHSLWPALVVAGLRIGGEREVRVLIAVPDAVDDEDGRRLRQWLRCAVSGRVRD